jgi:hypothetical protein
VFDSYRRTGHDLVGKDAVQALCLAYISMAAASALEPSEPPYLQDMRDSISMAKTNEWTWKLPPAA